MSRFIPLLSQRMTPTIISSLFEDGKYQIILPLFYLRPPFKAVQVGHCPTLGELCTQAALIQAGGHQ